MRRRHLIVALALAAALAGCETGVDTAASEPPAMSEALRPLVGHWQGTIWEIGTIGGAAASGMARMRHGWLVLSGTATAPDGHQDVIYYELTGDANTRWGQIAASFHGGDGQSRAE